MIFSAIIIWRQEGRATLQHTLFTLTWQISPLPLSNSVWH